MEINRCDQTLADNQLIATQRQEGPVTASRVQSQWPTSRQTPASSTTPIKDSAAPQGDDLLPRSVASDGRRSVLFLHVIVHILALAANIVSCVYMWDDFVQTQMQTGATVAAALHGIGILLLLSLAASEVKQLAFVVSMSLIYTFLGAAVVATAAMSVFTFRSDDKLTEPHWLYTHRFSCRSLVCRCLRAVRSTWPPRATWPSTRRRWRPPRPPPGVEGANGWGRGATVRPSLCATQKCSVYGVNGGYVARVS